MDNLSEIEAAIESEDTLKQHYGIIGIRKIIGDAENVPIQAIIDAGLIPKIMDYAKQS
jgi:hypothetical protein